MDLDKKYRPKSIKTFVGNNVAIEIISKLIGSNYPASTLLIGPSGCGKTTLARIIAKSLNVDQVYELNISNTRGIDDARDIIKNMKYNPLVGKGKVVILNECHGGTVPFQNTMLEVLEEPPKNVYFILVTTNPEKLLQTIKTRCTIIALRKLIKEELDRIISRVLKFEKRKLSKRVRRGLVNAADGCPRTLLIALGNILTADDTDEQLDILDNFFVDEESRMVNELCQCLLRRVKYKQMMSIAEKFLDQDLENVRRSVLGYFAKVLINNDNPIAAIAIENFSESYIYTGKAGFVYSIYSTLKEVEGE